LWILNAVVIGTVVIAAAAAATTTGHTVVAAGDHFLLYYAGVLALIALTAEVGIGLVASDRIFMKPSARVTAQALHRAMGFGAIAFLIIHIALEIIAGRSQPADTVVPFLDKGKTFYLGLGTVAFDIFIVIMMTGIYRARLAANMSPKVWRVIHASAYAAWIFGLLHGLLAGRPAKAFFGFSGFVYWAYGACVVAVAVALMVRLVAKNRARNELASHPVADSGGAGGWTAAAAALTSAGAIPGAAALSATAMPAPALTAGSPGALDGARARSRPPGRAPLALPAGASPGQPPGRQGRSAPYDERAAYLADTRRIGAIGPIGPGAAGSLDRTGQSGGAGQFGEAGQHVRERTGPYGQTGPLQRVGPFEQTGPMPRVARHGQTGPMPRVGQSGQAGGYQSERTGEIDRRGQFGQAQYGQSQYGQAPHGQPEFGQPQHDRVQGGQVPGGQAAYGPPSGTLQPEPAQYGQPAPAQYGQRAPAQYGQPASAPYSQPAAPMRPRQPGQSGRYERPHDDWSGPMQRIGPSATPPRYAAGNYDDWSGPLERIDPAAPPARYGVPDHYAPPAQYGADGQFTGGGQYERPGPEPRYERTGEIDRSGPYAAQPQYGSPAGDPSYGAAVPGYGPAGYASSQHGDEDQYGPPMLSQQSRPYERPRPAQYQSAPYQSGQYQSGQGAQYQPPEYQPPQYRPPQYQPAQNQPPAGYERGGHPGQYQAPTPYEEPPQYDVFQRRPAGRSGQYSRPDSDPQERAAHYATFAEQDATYTRPRPAGARDQFSPQDETDPLNIVPLNTGNYT